MIGFAVDEGITLDSFAPIVVKCLFKQFAISIGLVINTLSIGQVIESRLAEGALFLMISLMVFQVCLVSPLCFSNCVRK